MMHCTSTIIESTAPVMTAISCCRKLPAMGMPWRISISLPVQHMPTTLMPLAPCFSDRAIISGSCVAATIISDNVGSCPCRTILTWSSLSTPRFDCERCGVGVPKRTSDSSVATIDPPHPSEIDALSPWRIRFTGSLSTPIWVRCMISTISRSMPRGSMPISFHKATRFSGARRVNCMGPSCLPNSA